MFVWATKIWVYLPDLCSFPPSLSSLGCEAAVSKYCSIVTVWWRAQCPPSCLALLTQGDSLGNEYCNKLLRHLIFARQVDGWHSRDLIERDLPARRELAVLSLTVSGEGWFVFLLFFFFFYICVCTRNRSIAKDVNAILAFFFIPHYPLSVPEMRVLFDFN